MQAVRPLWAVVSSMRGPASNGGGPASALGEAPPELELEHPSEEARRRAEAPNDELKWRRAKRSMRSLPRL
jgi:hypothetical protein